MPILVDKAINQRLHETPPLATKVPPDDFLTAKSLVQAASLDLTIGAIYVPGTDDLRPGGAFAPLKQHALLEGHTAVIKTKEEMNLGNDLCGIAFPPASLSLQGLLMTNPGHIDPGYSGSLHLTVINMSNVPFPLKVGDRIVRVLLSTLADEPQASYSARQAGRRTASPVTPELLGKLSVDFLSVEKRSQRIAEETVAKAKFWSIAGPILAGAATIAATLLGTHLAVKGDIQKLTERTTALELKLPQQAFDERLRKLEEAVAKFTTASQK